MAISVQLSTATSVQFSMAANIVTSENVTVPISRGTGRQLLRPMAECPQHAGQ